MMDSFSVLNSLLVKLSDLVTPRQGDGSLHGCKHCVFVAGGGGCPFPFDLFFCFYWSDNTSNAFNISIRMKIATLFACLQADWVVSNVQLLSLVFKNYVSMNRDGLLVECQTHDWKFASSNPGRSGGRIFFSRVNFLCWLLFGVRSTPVLPWLHVKDPGHSAKSAVSRLDINTHASFTQWS